MITVVSTGRDGSSASYSSFDNVVDVVALAGGNGVGILSSIDSVRQSR